MNSFISPLKNEQDLPIIKKAVKQKFQHLTGVEGFGIGDNVINIYVSNSEVVKQLPNSFQGIPLNCIKTGMIDALNTQ